MRRVLILSSSLLTDRMLIHSEAVSALAEGAEVIIWATSRSHSGSERAWDSVPAQVEPFPKVRPVEGLPGKLIRSIAQRSWDFELGANTRLSKRHLALSTQPRGKRAAMIDMAGRICGFCRVSKALEELSTRLLRRTELSEEATHRLRALQPDLLVCTGVHRFHEPQVLLEAKRLCIPSVAMITSWDNITTKKRMLAQPEAYLVWSTQMREELRRYFPRSRTAPIFVVGAPQFDVFQNSRFKMSREEFCNSHGLDPSRPFVLYSLGSCNILKESFLVERLSREVDSGALRGTQLLLRPHPLFASSAKAAKAAGQSDNVRIQFTGDEQTALELRSQDEEMVRLWVSSFLHAAVVINFASTATVDAAIAGRPVVNVAFDPEPGEPHKAYVDEVYQRWEHYKPVTASGGVWLARSYSALLEATKTYLRDPHLHAEGRSWIIDYVCGHADGRNGTRMGDAILQHLSAVASPGSCINEAAIQGAVQSC